MDASDCGIAICITAILVILAFIHYKRKYSFWKSRGVVGPTPVPFIGNITDLVFHSLPIMFVERRKKYGRFYGIYEGSSPCLVISDPELIKQVCVKDFHSFVNRRSFDNFDDLFVNMISAAEDKQWKRLRKIISPTFTTGKIKRMKSLIDRCTRNATDYLELVAAKKEPVNIKQFWSRFTLEVIASCCFATEINSHKDPNNEFFTHVTRVFRPPGLRRRLVVLMFFLIPLRFLSFIKVDLFDNETTKFLSSVIKHLMKQRREKNGNYNDFLQLLMEAESEMDKHEEPLTENEIIANCILFFVAGYETTANLLHYCTYVLAVNQDIQQKLYDEITSHFKNSEDVDYDTASKLSYLDAVISETLRMYPPAIANERRSGTEVEVGDTGVKIPPNTLVSIPVYALHHDPEYYPEPEKFKPERFLEENKDQLTPYSYCPFGVGPRNCIAMRFALIEAKLAIIQTLLKFKIVKSVKTEAPKFSKYSTLLICNDIFVEVVKR